MIHIAERLRRIESYAQGGREEFMRSVMVQDAVIRNFEIIGEAAKRISPAFRDKHPHVPWRRLAGLRDVLIHAYDRVRVDEVWGFIERDPPDLKDHIQRVPDALQETQ